MKDHLVEENTNFVENIKNAVRLRFSDVVMGKITKGEAYCSHHVHIVFDDYNGFLIVQEDCQGLDHLPRRTAIELFHEGKLLISYAFIFEKDDYYEEAVLSRIKTAMNDYNYFLGFKL